MVDVVWCDAELDVQAIGGQVNVEAAQLDHATSGAWLVDGEGFGEGDDEPTCGADGSGGGDVVCSHRWGLRRARRGGEVTTLGDGVGGEAWCR